MAVYHNKAVCPMCYGANELTVKDHIDGTLIMEAATKCRECGHRDYWAYGHFMGPEPEDKETSSPD